ncbi:MAG: MBL fold metallo-hydrolase [Bacteroidales bacterium]
MFKISVIYNNMSSSDSLRDGWGYSAWIETEKGQFLFDTGGNSERFLYNLEKAGFHPPSLNGIIISHQHWDHVNGLAGLRDKIKKNLPVYVPFPDMDRVEETAGRFNYIEVKELMNIDTGIFISAPISFKYKEDNMAEQFLILVKDEELMIITGCCHPGLETIISYTKNQFPGLKIKLITGGFHMAPMNEAEIHTQFSKLVEENVDYVAPSHCSGDAAVEIAKKLEKIDFVPLFLGDHYTF